MPDVFDVLSLDHREVQRMLSELESGPTKATGASDNDLLLRKKMVEQLVIEESRHEAVEEMYFWPTVREKLPGGDALADTAIKQEQEGKQILHDLDKLDASDPGFERLITRFIDAGREHIGYEETKVWPGLRAALTAEESSQLGGKLTEAKKTAPTRPHPNTPPSPGMLKATGPVAAMADRARDAATGRGQD
jgi:Hemerythrin HHE cation binding domain